MIDGMKHSLHTFAERPKPLPQFFKCAVSSGANLSQPQYLHYYFTNGCWYTLKLEVLIND
jgi:hypothetical protein